MNAQSLALQFLDAHNFVVHKKEDNFLAICTKKCSGTKEAPAYYFILLFFLILILHSKYRRNFIKILITSFLSVVYVFFIIIL